MTGLTYLLGKLGGAWLAILLSWCVVLPVAGLLGWCALGPYEVSPYLQVCLAGALPLALIHVGLCLLLAALISPRRVAVTTVLVFGLICFLVGTLNSNWTEINFWSLLNPGRPYIYDDFWLGWIDRTHGTSLGIGASWLSVAVGVVQSVACGSLVWRGCAGVKVACEPICFEE